MTKRFKHHLGFICEKRDGEYYSFTIREVCDLLNDLSDENEQLKSYTGEMEDYLARLEEKNEQLKQQCKDFMEMLDDMCIAYLVNDGLEEILND